MTKTILRESQNSIFVTWYFDLGYHGAVKSKENSDEIQFLAHTKPTFC